MNNRTIVAFFDSREAAQRTVEKLVRSGVARTDINMVEGERRLRLPVRRRTREWASGNR